LAQCRPRGSRAPTGQTDDVAWRRRGKDTLDKGCTSTEGRRERGTGNGERGTGNGERGTRNEERRTKNGERGLVDGFTMWGEETTEETRSLTCLEWPSNLRQKIYQSALPTRRPANRKN